MSINGLDATTITEAYAAAVAQSGGWLLLRYVSRDEVQLSGRGSGGLAELRDAVVAHEVALPSSQFNLPSPLFGFLHYRRRRVVLKYQPDNCSQLVQARATVHFMAVCDVFSPHHTSFSFSSTRDLRDSALSAACSLHTATGSSSSSSSQRRRRLCEIAEEDGEDEDGQNGNSHVNRETQERPSKRRSIGPAHGPVHNAIPGAASVPLVRPSIAAATFSFPSPIIPIPHPATQSPSHPTENGSSYPGRVPAFVGTLPPRLPSSASSFETSTRRMSTQSGRPDLYSLPNPSYHRQKTRLGPRPSRDLDGRPHTATGNLRPVSQLPAGLRLSSKAYSRSPSASSAGVFPASEHSKPPLSKSGLLAHPSLEPDYDPKLGLVSPARDSGMPASDAASVRSSLVQPSPARSHTSSGDSARHGNGSHTSSPAYSAMFTKPTVSLEKARLMKALQLREKRRRVTMTMAATAAASESSAPSPAVVMIQDYHSFPERFIPPPAEHPDEASEPATQMIDPDPVASLQDTHLFTATTPSEVVAQRDSDSDGDMKVRIAPTNSESCQADLSAEFHAASPTITVNDHISEATRSDSRPASPMPESSQLNLSTRASSLSESTAETAQPSGREATDLDEKIRALALLSLSLYDDDDDEVQSERQSIVPREGDCAPDELCGTPAAAQLSPERQSDTTNSDADSCNSAVSTSQSLLRPQLLIPKSKFSTQDLRAAAARSASDSTMTTVTVRTAETEDLAVFGQANRMPGEQQQQRPLQIPTNVKEAAYLTVTSISAYPSPPISPHSSAEPFTEPTNDTDFSSPTSLSSQSSSQDDAEYLARWDGKSDEDDEAETTDEYGDDDLMEELRLATVHEAKPVTVSKSPITSLFPSMANNRIGLLRGSLPSPRTVSNPGRGSQTALGVVPRGPTRSLSTSSAKHYHQASLNASTGLTPKKGHLGSSISQRIKALEKFASSPSPAGGAAFSDNSASRNAPVATISALRKRGGSVMDHQGGVNRPSTSDSTSLVIKRSPPTRTIAAAAASCGDPSDSSPQARAAAAGVAAVAAAVAAVAGSPLRSRASSATKQPLVMNGSPAMAERHCRTESIQVTARIMRNVKQPNMKSVEASAHDPAASSRLELQQSPLQVNVQHGPDPLLRPVRDCVPDLDESTRQGGDSKDRQWNRSKSKEVSTEELPSPSAKSRRSSLSIVKGFIKEQYKSLPFPLLTGSEALSPRARGNAGGAQSPTWPPSTHQNTSITHRLSIGSRRSSSSRETLLPAPGSVTPSWQAGAGDLMGEGGPISPTTSSSSSPAEKGSSSLTGRFMRRLSASLGGGIAGAGSGLGSGRGKAFSSPGLSPTVREEDDVSEVGGPACEYGGGQEQQASIVAYMGDVNVQFPDTLLWKRRSLCVDSHGFLILSVLPVPAHPPLGQREGPGLACMGMKRYRFRQFRPPYVPEMEVQELPNSVVLEFVDGSGLQIACEDRTGQLRVLHALEDAHQLYGCR